MELRFEMVTPTSIRGKVADGAILLTFVRIFTRVFDFVTLIILTRHLLPREFGLVAIALTVMQITEAVMEMPTAQVLLQIASPKRRHLDTAFTLSLLRGLAIGVFLCAVAWPLALFYGDMRLVALICALALAPATRSLRSPKLFEYYKAMRFGPDALAETIGKAAALVASASVAIATGSYWAIAIATITAPFVGALASFVIAPYRPRLTLVHWRLFHKYIGWNMAGQVASALNWQCDRFTLGKLTSQTTLGLFSIAKDLGSTVLKAMIDTLARPIIVAFSTVRHDSVRLATAFSKVISVTYSIGLPVAVGQALLAREFIFLIFGPKWVEAAPVFQAVCLGFIPGFYSNTSSALFYALGKPELVFSRNFADFVFRVPLMIGSILLFGWIGAAYALVLAEVWLALICLTKVSKLLDASWTSQIVPLWRGMLSVLAMTVAVEMARWDSPRIENVAAAVDSLLRIVPLAAVVYVATHIATWWFSGRPEGVEWTALGLVRSKFRKPAIL
ncbi:oligosaccharide flippase family protein [Novosphingobium album (ex Hu et al. 2023)]|uniref:Oligosaccharide flippase family protein n=1 Tax=Novosphingobium album (ex Hu et al. 2023) TaxID=2930093 RepID=A0ABT0B4P5_9SPHN|nr:oligosaccharide flippase family protein [Novosphingobium album (ex Hu et al. 2023)]MCJ2179789.1 oligosaccharide flippase family protein [Novosphingobium album (ex Hu et al. 2023)]